MIYLFFLSIHRFIDLSFDLLIYSMIYLLISLYICIHNTRRQHTRRLPYPAKASSTCYAIKERPHHVVLAQCHGPRVLIRLALMRCSLTHAGVRACRSEFVVLYLFTKRSSGSPRAVTTPLVMAPLTPPSGGENIHSPGPDFRHCVQCGSPVSPGSPRRSLDDHVQHGHPVAGRLHGVGPPPPHGGCPPARRGAGCREQARRDDAGRRLWGVPGSPEDRGRHHGLLGGGCQRPAQAPGAVRALLARRREGDAGDRPRADRGGEQGCRRAIQACGFNHMCGGFRRSEKIRVMRI